VVNLLRNLPKLVPDLVLSHTAAASLRVSLEELKEEVVKLPERQARLMRLSLSKKTYTPRDTADPHQLAEFYSRIDHFLNASRVSASCSLFLKKKLATSTLFRSAQQSGIRFLEVCLLLVHTEGGAVVCAPLHCLFFRFHLRCSC
jgi:hypothetical protein